MLKNISYFFIATCIVATVSFQLLADAESPPVTDRGPIPFGCRFEQAVTIPAQTNTAQVMLDLYALEDGEHERILRGPNRIMEQEVRDLFDLSAKKSKEVYDFDNVDLWGAFGSRGMVDVDINYVAVKSVEFLKGNALGLVKAKVSRREFEANQHSFLLELITKYVTDKSVQPIDW